MKGDSASPKYSRTGASQSYCLVLYPGHSFGVVLTPLQRSSRCILEPQPTGPRDTLWMSLSPLQRNGVFFSPSRLGLYMPACVSEFISVFNVIMFVLYVIECNIYIYMCVCVRACVCVCVCAWRVVTVSFSQIQSPHNTTRKNKALKHEKRRYRQTYVSRVIYIYIYKSILVEIRWLFLFL